MESIPPASHDASAVDWKDAARYAALYGYGRRGFAWEWLRRSFRYRRAWKQRDDDPEAFGLVAYADPDLCAADARPIWSHATDPQVLCADAAIGTADPNDLFDVRRFAPFVSVEVSAARVEHWLLSEGGWSIRLDLHDATLLGGPLLLSYRLSGLEAAMPKTVSLQRLLALARNGALAPHLHRHEPRAARWVNELRTADGLMAGASQQEIARVIFGTNVALRRWRIESPAYRLRVQRLVKAAQRRLDAPLVGPWFQ